MQRKPWHTLVVISVICVVSLWIHAGSLNSFPQYIHSWAQCDRYALALGFLTNGGDLFHPETFVMNNQFPGEFMIPRTTSITSVDFPVHDYIVSWVMRLSHSTEPWTFRLYTLLYSLVGLFFLYKLAALFTNSFSRKLLVVLFAMSSPVFLYYQAGFLPTIPSLANSIIGLYYYIRFLKTSGRRFFFLSVAFVTLAALARLPFSILLVAMMCYELWMLFKRRRPAYDKTIGFLIAVLLIALYYRYNAFLREHYGSLFLNYLIPATSFQDFGEFTKAALSRWGFDYFTEPAWLLFAVLGIVGLYLAWRNRRLADPLQHQFLFLTLIFLSGCCLYYLLMCYQFVNHDYYFLDTFYLPLVCLFLFFVLQWPVFHVRFYLSLAPLLLFLPAFVLAHKHINDRIALFGSNERSSAVIYKNASALLDSLGVAPNANVLVLGSDGSNNTFILLKRKGFVIIDPEKEKVERALNWPWDVVVTDRSTMITSIYRHNPRVIEQLQELGSRGLILVYIRRASKTNAIDTTKFFALAKVPAFCTVSGVPGADTTATVLPAGADNLSAARYTQLSPDQEYGKPLYVKDCKALKRPWSVLKVSCRVESEQVFRELLMCVSMKANGQEQFFDAVDLVQQSNSVGVRSYTALYLVPQTSTNHSELGIFIWNKGKNLVRYGDFQVTIY